MPHVPSWRTTLGDAVSRWAVESQQGARRNAMVASTALAARRKERADVDDFLAERGDAVALEHVEHHEVRGAL
ncbi:hypothetical protein [Nocardioides sp. CFH 31398]|uniref:hypothetical protein n=1 Tax=Nocardioides sp. CFH 31398 TaxID=2919579 RepID=UPI001F06A094|nr:hypothetical protein [Nocardioides sp. CFH 31398]MCH1867300.1 hypothetical protein [Nocardioides sp. CFH 31398]